MTNTQHTKTPWESKNNWAIVAGVRSYEKRIAVMHEDNTIPADERKANAQFIVKACNNYKALVEMVDNLQAVLSITLSHAKIDKSSISLDAYNQLGLARQLLASIKER